MPISLVHANESLTRCRWPKSTPMQQHALGTGKCPINVDQHVGIQVRFNHLAGSIQIYHGEVDCKEPVWPPIVPTLSPPVVPTPSLWVPTQQAEPLRKPHRFVWELFCSGSCGSCVSSFFSLLAGSCASLFFSPRPRQLSSGRWQ